MPGAEHIPLDQLVEHMDALSRTDPIVTVCMSGYQSSIASSLLRWSGFAAVSNMRGGMTASATEQSALMQQSRSEGVCVVPECGTCDQQKERGRGQINGRLCDEGADAEVRAEGVDGDVEQDYHGETSAGAVEEPGVDEGLADSACGPDPERKGVHAAATPKEEWEVPKGPEYAYDCCGEGGMVSALEVGECEATPANLFPRIGTES